MTTGGGGTTMATVSAMGTAVVTGDVVAGDGWAGEVVAAPRRRLIR